MRHSEIEKTAKSGCYGMNYPNTSCILKNSTLYFNMKSLKAFNDMHSIKELSTDNKKVEAELRIKESER